MVEQGRNDTILVINKAPVTELEQRYAALESFIGCKKQDYYATVALVLFAFVDTPLLVVTLSLPQSHSNHAHH